MTSQATNLLGLPGAESTHTQSCEKAFCTEPINLFTNEDDQTLVFSHEVGYSTYTYNFLL